MSKVSKVLPAAVLNDRRRVQIFFDDDPGVTQQHFRDETNVNSIMAKYGASRIISHYAQFQGNYGDFTDVQDYQTSLNEVIKAQDMFMSLPSELRNRFNNDPAQFLDFVGNDANRDEMKTLGLLRDEAPVANLVPSSVVLGDENAPI